jgi:hypothetical protein
MGRAPFDDVDDVDDLDDLDAKILAILNKSLFELARLIAETFCIGLATVVRHSYDSIGFRSFHLH